VTDPMTLRLRNEEQLLAAVTSNREEFYRATLQPYKLRGYVEYLQSRSGWGDVKILWDTVVAVIFPRRIAVPTLKEILSKTVK
jgi:hypothetical protein